MDISKTTWASRSADVIPAQSDGTVSERLNYLRPSRYFHLYLLKDPKASRTCWLPEGYRQ